MAATPSSVFDTARVKARSRLRVWATRRAARPIDGARHLQPVLLLATSCMHRRAALLSGAAPLVKPSTDPCDWTARQRKQSRGLPSKRRCPTRAVALPLSCLNKMKQNAYAQPRERRYHAVHSAPCLRLQPPSAATPGTALRRRATCWRQAACIAEPHCSPAPRHFCCWRQAACIAEPHCTRRRHEGTLCFHRPRRLLRASAWAEGCGRYRSRSCGTKKSARPDDLLNHTRGLIITILALVVHSSTPLPLLGPCTSPPQTLNASALIALVLYPHESLSMRAR